EGITGSVTIQNVEAFPLEVTVTAYAGNSTTITLNPRASQTFDADPLGIPAGPGSGVAASAGWATADREALYSVGICEDSDQETVTRGTPKDTVDTTTTFQSFGVDMVKVVQNGKTYVEGTDYNWSLSGGYVAI